MFWLPQRVMASARPNACTAWWNENSMIYDLQWQTTYRYRHDIVVQLDLTWYDYVRLYLSPINQRCISFELPKRILSQPYCTIVYNPTQQFPSVETHKIGSLLSWNVWAPKPPPKETWGMEATQKWSGSTLPCDKTGTLFHNLETQGLSPE